MAGLLIFIASALMLVGGYMVYSRLAERIYGFNTAMQMPCEKLHDVVDYVSMPSWRVFMIQLLNIAGLGPVFGALSGCLFGPVCLVWIVLGCILAGAVHDFMAAMASAERDGENLPEFIGRQLGKSALVVMRSLCILLMLLVGVVFTTGPAGMLHELVNSVSTLWWCAVILLYYILATILPIDVIIGKIYPVFGALFLCMAVSIAFLLPFSGYEIMPVTDFITNMHPDHLSVWPMLFVTIACGAISGFHATQSPMMVRCLSSAKNMRPVFYGAMITEGLVALIWAVAGMTLRDVIGLAEVTPPVAVNKICSLLLGPGGAVLAVLGVVVLPITSGDTAMRCCRLMVADALKINQKNQLNRLWVALPLFALVVFIANLDFKIIWRYFGWANQTLACFTLWAIAVLLKTRGRFHWMVSLPAFFMTNVCISFLLCSPDCLNILSVGVATMISFAISTAFFLFFLVRYKPDHEKLSS
ncbi:MAG: carbon starvation protein A [Akkermansiaceae bacterium]|nr:carbon starvation protein A [Akkermansiaceae bacterium]